jgi:toluene monooxygenase system protein A
MLNRDEWLDLARKLDWTFSYVSEEEAFPAEISGKPWLSNQEWQNWEEPFKTSFREYARNQASKAGAVRAVREALGHPEDFQKLPKSWLCALKLHSATLPLAEFAATVGNLRAARFGRACAWRSAALLGALDELRHTQIPLQLMHELVRLDGQFDWTHKFYHSNNWVAIAGRHLIDELLLGSDPIEFAVATNFVFETGFTNLQFVGLSALAKNAGDKMFETMVNSIQSDEARHAQIGKPVLEKIIQQDPEYAQFLLDKWFWRSWRLFAVVTGFSMDYFTPVEERTLSFKEFMHEWVLEQYVQSLESLGMKKPWYWDLFLEDIEFYHHMVYASAYTYRSTVWFDFVLPGPKDRSWLRKKYPKSWKEFDPVWEQISRRWREADIGNDFAVHGTAIVSFCDLCQIVLSAGTPSRNTAIVEERDGKKRVFCSEPCRWIFMQQPERYESHNDIVKRVLNHEAPANVIALVRRYFGLDFDTWGKDVCGGDYSWLERPRAQIFESWTRKDGP